jgi:DNA-binding transcriptional ArsR family regulator
MRRLSRLLDALGSPAGLPVLAALLEEPRGQDALKKVLAEQDIPVTAATLSSLMIRFEDLGLVDRDNQKAPYQLRHREEVAAALLHLAALGVELAATEGAEAEALEKLSHRARLQMVEEVDPGSAEL